MIDFGIRSYDLAYALMEPWDLAVLVDAVPRGGAPGTVYVIEPDVQAAEPNVDAHSMNPVAVIQMVTALGGHLPRMIVVGCEPERTEAPEDGALGLSAPVSAAVAEAIRVIEEIVEQHSTRAAASPQSPQGAIA